MSDLKKRITDFADSADEKSLSRLLEVIEQVQSPVVGYTHTGEPVLLEDILNTEAGDKRTKVQDGFSFPA
jgi:hypothetical protein